MTRTTLIAAALMVAGTTATAAQRGARDGMARRPGVGQTLRFQPAMLLRHATQLELTDEQVERLTQLQTATLTARTQAHARAQRHQAQMREVLVSAEPALTAVREHFDAAHAARAELEWVAIRTALEARDVLTAAQRTQVAQARRARAGRGRARGGRARMRRSRGR